MLAKNNHPLSAYVVFDGETELSFLKGLKAGFRHCFLILEFETCWVSLDPLSCFCEVQHFDKAQIQDLPLWLKYQGYQIAQAPINRSDLKIRPFDYWSCVSFIKRVLGIQKWWVITPWQLKKYIYRCTKI